MLLQQQYKDRADAGRTLAQERRQRDYRYEDFSQTPDAEVRVLLQRAWREDVHHLV